MRNKILILTSALFLAACQTVPQQPTVEIRTVEVKVPVPVYCKTETPAPPKFCFKGLKESDDIFVKNRCILSDRKKHIAYEIELNAALASCK